MPDNLKEKMLGAVAWSSVDRVGQQAIQFVIGLFLLRILSPDDYGLYGMVIIFSALSMILSDGGFAHALIRKQKADDTDYCSVFYVNIFISASLYAILFFSAPYIADFYNQPVLVDISRVLFLGILFNAAYLIPASLLHKEMDFKTMAKVNISSTTISYMVGISLALTGYGVWSLIIQQVLYHFFRLTGFYYFVKWHPKLLFSIKAVRELWKFSMHLLGTSVLNVIFNSIYTIIFGKFYTKTEVGYYTNANKLSETFIFSFQSILVNSSYSLFSKIQDQTERLTRIFREIVGKTSLVVFPVLFVLIIIIDPFTFVVLKEKWLPSIFYFRILCVAGLFIPLYNLNISLLNSRGKSKISFRLEIIKKAIILLSIFICFSYGAQAMIIGYAAACIISYFVSMLYIRQELQHQIRQQLNDIAKAFFIGIFIAFMIYLPSLFIVNKVALLCLQSLAALLLYVLIIRFLYNDIYTKALSFLAEKLDNLKRNKS